MKIRIEVETNNAAWVDNPELSKADLVWQFQNALCRGESKPLYDLNGNSIGVIKIENERS